ncbi:MAG: hypothetical protein JWO42_1596 [Chloroflexi bacterium]|nr:hypothetical protein [Chloroflexota bacterium]
MTRLGDYLYGIDCRISTCTSVRQIKQDSVSGKRTWTRGELAR